MKVSHTHFELGLSPAPIATYRDVNTPLTDLYVFAQVLAGGSAAPNNDSYQPRASAAPSTLVDAANEIRRGCGLADGVRTVSSGRIIPLGRRSVESMIVGLSSHPELARGKLGAYAVMKVDNPARGTTVTEFGISNTIEGVDVRATYGRLLLSAVATLAPGQHTLRVNFDGDCSSMYPGESVGAMWRHLRDAPNADSFSLTTPPSVGADLVKATSPLQLILPQAA